MTGTVMPENGHDSKRPSRETTPQMTPITMQPLRLFAKQITIVHREVNSPATFPDTPTDTLTCSLY